MDALGVCHELCPGGKIEGHEFVFDPGSGKIKVHLQGDKAGIWSHFGGDGAGDLLDLYVKMRGGQLTDALDWARARFGIEKPQFQGSKPREYRKPERPEHMKAIEVGGDADSVDYYLRQERGLAPATLKRFRVTEAPWLDGVNKKGEATRWPGPWILFPFLRPGADGKNELVNIKWLHLRRKPHATNPGKTVKVMIQEKDCEPGLYGWQAASPVARNAIIHEGEIDAMTGDQYLTELKRSDAIAVFSVPAGCGRGEKQQWIEHDFDRLERLEDIAICFDGDKEGQDKIALEEIVTRLGVHRCRIMKLPYKDANEALLKGMSAEDYLAAWQAAKPMAPDELRSASEYADAVMDEFYPASGEEPGLKFPWKRLSFARMRRREVAIWLGFNSGGKALDIETPIATSEGWKTMGGVEVGDIVFDERGRPTTVTFTSPIMHGRPCFRVAFSDGSEIIADADHRWVTWDAQARQSLRSVKNNERRRRGAPLDPRKDQTHKRTHPAVRTTAEIAATMKGPGCWAHLSNHSIVVAGALQRPTIDLPIDPYLLGLWLGDGHSWSATFFTNDGLQQAFSDGGFSVSKNKDKYGWGIRGGFFRLLRLSGLFNNKHVPDVYFLGSIEQRLSLLQGLMDSDGHIDELGGCEFTSINERLARAVCDLVLSLGHQATMTVSSATLNGRIVSARFRVSFAPEFAAFRLSRKAARVRSKPLGARERHRFISSCEPVASRPVRCIQVAAESHLFLAGHSLIPTHNTMVLNQVAMHVCDAHERVCIGSFEMPPPKLLERSVRQLMKRERPSRGGVQAAMRWFDGRLWIVDRIGNMDLDRLLAVFLYARRRFGCSFFVIDSFLKLSIAEDDYTGQKKAMEKVITFADQEDCHVALVMHSRKLQDMKKGPSRMDARGAQALTDLAQMVMVMWRNEEKEQGLSTIQEDPALTAAKREEKRADLVNKPDAVLRVDKQRFGRSGEIGNVQLWFDKSAVSFKDKQSGDLPYFDTVPRDVIGEAEQRGEM